MKTRASRMLGVATVAAAVLALLGTSPAMAASPVTVDFTGGAWDSGTGYPVDVTGGTGVSGAVADLGGGLTATVTYSEHGGTLAAGRDGSALGNLNLLDGPAIADINNPGSPTPAQCHSTTDTYSNIGTPRYGCHETSGFALNIESSGPSNSTSLVNYVRYDFAFNQLVTIPDGVTLSDIDSLRVQYIDAFPAEYQVDLYQDAVGFEFWANDPGTPGTGLTPSLGLGSSLSSSSVAGVSYVHSTIAPVGGRGGLNDSGNTANRAVFASAAPVRGFSIYYWDQLTDDSFDSVVTVFPTVGLENFEVIPATSQLEVSKTVLYGSTPWQFVVTVAGSNDSVRNVTLTDANPSAILEVDPGVTYTVTEADSAGYVLESIDCGNGTDSFQAPFDDGTAAAETHCEVTNTGPTPTPTATPVAPTTSTPSTSPSPDPEQLADTGPDSMLGVLGLAGFTLVAIGAVVLIGVRRKA